MKFRLEDIKTEHQKVKSGADFPPYIQAIKRLGVSHYITYVSDGHTEYFDTDHQSIQTGSQYQNITVSENINLENFKRRLQLHQQGGTDYMTFCNDCAAYGVEGWKMDLNAMTCAYFSENNDEVLVERIPG